ncbi:hypothetical protein [Geodermatophilus marinus]|uniref:hypothetical protein n=1 Tax=Geodermatophilus sp. LHW52908 TaxID=2303986 RepID=UPI0018F489FB|nr:hypothetical protein [Geodermatophilus sp. LHW52908]
MTGLYEFDGHELELLVELCRTLDVLAELDAVIQRGGVLTEAGKASPAVVEARQQRLSLARLVGALRLPNEDGVSLSPAQAHAQKAAQARWNREKARRDRGA